jgi:hypothetical protein
LRGGINTFTYVKGNPLKLSDEDGLDPFEGGGDMNPPMPGLPDIFADARARAAQQLQEGVGRFIQRVKDFCEPNEKSSKQKCEKQWERAREFCIDLYANGYKPDRKGKLVGGKNIEQCIAGQVTESCGGNKVE